MEKETGEQDTIQKPENEEEETSLSSEEDETEETSEEDETEETSEEESSKIIAQLKKEKEELSAKNAKLYARLKKGEGKKEIKEVGLSEKDLFALMKANIDGEDVDEVKTFAAYKKITVADALKSKTLQSILSERAEERRTASATQTRGTRGTSKISGENLLEKARKGEVPDKEEDIQKLVEAKMANRKTG